MFNVLRTHYVFRSDDENRWLNTTHIIFCLHCAMSERKRKRKRNNEQRRKFSFMKFLIEYLQDIWVNKQFPNKQTGHKQSIEIRKFFMVFPFFSSLKSIYKHAYRNAKRNTVHWIWWRFRLYKPDYLYLY